MNVARVGTIKSPDKSHYNNLAKHKFRGPTYQCGQGREKVLKLGVDSDCLAHLSLSI